DALIWRWVVVLTPLRCQEPLLRCMIGCLPVYRGKHGRYHYASGIRPRSRCLGSEMSVADIAGKESPGATPKRSGAAGYHYRSQCHPRFSGVFQTDGQWLAGPNRKWRNDNSLSVASLGVVVWLLKPRALAQVQHYPWEICVFSLLSKP